MELKRKFDFRTCLTVVYVLFAAVYLIIGFLPAKAVDYVVLSELKIPKIGLQSEVAELELDNNRLETPKEIVGSFSWAKNKTLLIGHSTTVFSDLEMLEVGNEIFYDNRRFMVREIELLEKEQINMGEVLAAEEVETIVVMTCAGELLTNGDASHRLIITAVLVE